MKRKQIKFIAYVIIAVVALIYTMTEKPNDNFPDWEEGKLYMYVIDVGQADSTLFIFPDGENLLIDAGNREDTALVTDFLLNVGIEKLDTVIATHPHEDHIGGMGGVIRNFDIDEFYIPDAYNTTVYYTDMLDSLEEKDIYVNIAESGTKIKDDEYLVEILSPEDMQYENLNHESIVTKIEYKGTSFLVMGDAEKENEYNIIEKYGSKIESDVLRVGHHGSATSSTTDFLKAVNPKLALISVGADNDYGHPHREVVERLEKLEIPSLRTDISGNILIISDGEEITQITEKNEG